MSKATENDTNRSVSMGSLARVDIIEGQMFTKHPLCAQSEIAGPNTLPSSRKYNSFHPNTSLKYIFWKLSSNYNFHPPSTTPMIYACDSNIWTRIAFKSGTDWCLGVLTKDFGPFKSISRQNALKSRYLIAHQKFLDWSTFERVDHIRAKTWWVTL